LTAAATDFGVGFDGIEATVSPASSMTFAVVKPAATKGMVGAGTNDKKARAALGERKITAEKSPTRAAATEVGGFSTVTVV
jgi:hypothetical protein